MLIYLDMCCLKRPFDDQSQPRIRLESEAVLAIMALEPGELRIVRSAALTLENRRNPVKERALKVQEWLDAVPASPFEPTELTARIEAFIGLGFKEFDAMHVATAEQAGAEALATCDDRMHSTAKRHQDLLKVKVMQILDLAKEVAS